MKRLEHLGPRRPSIARRLSIAAVAAPLAFAGALLPASVAHAQMNRGVPQVANQDYNAVAAGWAQAGLISYLQGSTCPTCQIEGGENPFRLGRTNGSMMWHDANTVETILDYYEATVASGAPDTQFNGIVAAYHGYDPREPFSIAGYLDPIHAGWWGWVVDPLGEILGRGVLDPAIAKLISATGNPIDPNTLNVENRSNDDVLWWVVSMIRAYDDLGDPWFLQQAETTFASVALQWNQNPSCGGGVPWGDHGEPNLNAITNGLFFQAATRLALRDPDHQGVSGTIPGIVPSGRMSIAFDTNIPLTACVNAPPGVGCESVSLPDSYEGWAWAEYQWLNTYFISNRVPVGDTLDANCVPGTPAYTYNQALIMDGLFELSTIAAGANDPIASVMSATIPGATLLTQAQSFASLAMNQPQASSDFGWNNDPGIGKDILAEGCDVSGNCSTDQAEFKGILMRYMGHFASALANGGSGTTLPLNYNDPAALTSDPGLFSYGMGVLFNENASAIWNNALPGTFGPLFPEVWYSPLTSSTTSYEGTPGSTPVQEIQTSGVDGLVAAMWLPRQPTCEGGSYCGGACCGSGNTCTSAGVCCPSGQVNSDGTCCPQYTFAENGICCALGEINLNGACCAPSAACGSSCGCPSGTTCSGWGSSAASSSCVGVPTCSSGTFACGTTCCSSSTQVCAPTFDSTNAQNGQACAASCPVPGYSGSVGTTCAPMIP